MAEKKGCLRSVTLGVVKGVGLTADIAEALVRTVVNRGRSTRGYRTYGDFERGERPRRKGNPGAGSRNPRLN